MQSELINSQLIESIKSILHASRTQLQHSINSVMVQTYWNIGRLIVEDEQKGVERAEYGKKQLEQISNNLTLEFGKGFNTRNLRNMRQFYLTFPIWNAVSAKLSWTHYRRLIRVEKQQAREWYIAETIAHNWSARALDRQINNLYYERLLSSTERLPVEEEAEKKIKELQVDAKNYLRDPYIFDFLNLPSQSLLESNIESEIKKNLLGLGYEV